MPVHLARACRSASDARLVKAAGSAPSSGNSSATSADGVSFPSAYAACRGSTCLVRSAFSFAAMQSSSRSAAIRVGSYYCWHRWCEQQQASGQEDGTCRAGIERSRGVGATGPFIALVTLQPLCKGAQQHRDSLRSVWRCTDRQTRQCPDWPKRRKL